MTKPNFFIIGAPKCGTTTVYSWLKNHANIFMPDKKEPHYFAPDLSDRYCRVRNEKDYLQFFIGAQENQLCGEASVLYSFYPQSIKNILSFNKDAKIIYMLRNPVDMAPSYHRQLINNLEENAENFETAWALQNERAEGKSIPSTSKDPDLLQYSQHCALGSRLEEIQAIVPPAQLHVILLDDLASAPGKTYADALAFLNLENDGRENFTAENEAYNLKFKFLKKLSASNSFFIRAIKPIAKKIISLDKITNKNPIKNNLESAFKQALLSHFENEIQLIEKNLNRQLGSWRK